MSSYKTQRIDFVAVVSHMMEDMDNSNYYITPVRFI